MQRKILYFAALIIVLWAAFRPPLEPDPPVAAVAAAAEIEISPAQFATYLEELSEPEGYFDTDNFISNETSYLHAINDLRKRVPAGGIYLGVGPDQNFSYIAHTRPALAIVIDIRRQNMLQHLLYKALFEMSASRAEFLARLLSRQVPASTAATSLPELLSAIRRSPASEEGYQANFAAVRRRLTESGLKLTADDFEKMDYVYRTFYDEGLDLRFSSIGRNNAANYPTFESLLMQTGRDGDLQGYLSSEDLFLWLKRFHSENRLLPIVGDFSGPRAFKAVAAFLKGNGVQVTTFYTSNVEFYLFGSDQWDRYVENVRALPMAANAVFVRAYFGNSGSHPLSVPGHRSTTLVQSVSDFLRDQAAGRFRTYRDVIFR